MALLHQQKQHISLERGAGDKLEWVWIVNVECLYNFSSWFLSPPTENIILDPTAYDRLHVGDEITQVRPLPVAKPHFLITKSKSKSSPCSLLWTDLFLCLEIFIWAPDGLSSERNPRVISLPPSYILIPSGGVLQLHKSVGKPSLTQGLTHLVIIL